MLYFILLKKYLAVIMSRSSDKEHQKIFKEKKEKSFHSRNGFPFFVDWIITVAKFKF